MLEIESDELIFLPLRDRVLAPLSLSVVAAKDRALSVAAALLLEHFSEAVIDLREQQASRS
jgi:hypothetical protein